MRSDQRKGDNMICASCLAKGLVGSLEKCIVKATPKDYGYLNDIYDELRDCSKGNYCSLCGHIIDKNEICYNEYALVEKTITSVGEMLSQKILYCEQCGVGEILDDYSWSVRKSCDDEEEREEIESDLSRLDTSEPIEDLFWNYFEGDCWVDYLSDIASNMYCPNCMNGSGENYEDKTNYGEFDQYTEVFTKSDVDEFNYRFYGLKNDLSPDELLENLANNFEYEEIRKITKDYIDGEKSTLALKKLEEYIRDLFEKHFYYVLAKKRQVYRTRPNEKEEPFDAGEMWEPPFASQGRYNEKGVSVLYCANCIDAVKAEVDDKGKGYSIGKFVVNKDMRLFPVNRIFLGKYAEYVISDDSAKTTKGDKKSYMLTNLVSSMCQRVGYDGVAYMSVKKCDYVNYALFNNFVKGKDINCIGVINDK